MRQKDSKVKCNSPRQREAVFPQRVQRAHVWSPCHGPWVPGSTVHTRAGTECTPGTPRLDASVQHVMTTSHVCVDDVSTHQTTTRLSTSCTQRLMLFCMLFTDIVHCSWAIRACLAPLPMDWNHRSGRPQHVWLGTIDMWHYPNTEGGGKNASHYESKAPSILQDVHRQCLRSDQILLTTVTNLLPRITRRNHISWSSSVSFSAKECVTFH